MNKYAELKRHADELSRLLRVPMPGNEKWDGFFDATMGFIRAFGEGPVAKPQEPEPEAAPVSDLEAVTEIPPPLNPVEDMTRPELMDELGIKSTRRSKADLQAEVAAKRAE